MDDDCYIPLSLSFSPAVLGPFTARECLSLFALVPAALVLLRYSVFWASVSIPFLLSAGCVLVLEERRGRHPFGNLLSYLGSKFGGSDLRTVLKGTIKSADPSRCMYRVEDVNYAFALTCEREAFLGSFQRICQVADGCIHFVSVPSFEGQEEELCYDCDGKDHAGGCTAGGRSFFVSLPRGFQHDLFPVGASQRPVSLEDEKAVHPLIDERLLELMSR